MLASRSILTNSVRRTHAIASSLRMSFHTRSNGLRQETADEQLAERQQKAMEEHRWDGQEGGEFWNPSQHYKSGVPEVELPEEFNVDEFLDKEDEERRTKDIGDLYTFRATPTLEHAKGGKYMANPYKFDKRLQPVWDYYKLPAFDTSRYPAIETEPIIPPKRKSDALDEYKVRSVDDVKNKFEFRSGVRSEELLEAGVVPDVENDQVSKIFGWQNSSQAEQNKKRIEMAIARFQKKPGDTGSTAVQIAILTEKINYLTDHMRKHHKDKSTQRGLQIIVNRRKKLMEYLKRKDGEEYWKVVKALDLRVL